MMEAAGGKRVAGTRDFPLSPAGEFGINNFRDFRYDVSKAGAPCQSGECPGNARCHLKNIHSPGGLE